MAQPVNDWSDYLVLHTGFFRDVGVCFGYGLSLVHLATFGSIHLSVYDYSHYTVKRKH